MNLSGWGPDLVLLGIGVPQYSERQKLACRRPYPPAQSLFDRCQGGRTLILNKDDEKLRRLCLTGVATDNVNVIGTFIEGLTSVKSDRLRPLDLHDDGTFQHINKCIRIMAMLLRADTRRSSSCPLCRGCRLGPARTTSSPSVLERRQEPRS